MSRPSRALATIFRAPRFIYQVGLGRLLGGRFLEVTHRGRTSGRLHTTILEVIHLDSDRGESIVVSAYGTGADWYRNLAAGPGVRVRTGRFDYVPEHRILERAEAHAAAVAFCRSHPWEARLVRRVLPLIGAAMPDDPAAHPADVLAGLPMVAFRPKL